MAIPAYARARIKYLNYRYLVEPKVEVRVSYRANSNKNFRIDDSKVGLMLKNEVYRIVDSYNSVPATPYIPISGVLNANQKAAFDSAIKQLNN